MSVVTRFAPSPTGHLHIGGARTALFSWLHARQHGGRFVLRVEDTDRERSEAIYVEAILEGMAWLGLGHDEGPYFQTQRFDRYRAVLEQLLASGHAYPCYCSRERLAALREAQQARGEKPRYDGYCRDREQTAGSEGDPPVIRFRTPREGSITVHDLIRGEIVFDNAELDDLIIARSDGTPTYNFTVVIDDTDMGITHVVRGDDHINNTPRQMHICQALAHAPPAYAHVPMILGADGKRLSKRHGAVSVLQYREEGYLPEALINYLARLGWSHGDEEIFDRDALLAHFRLTAVHKAPSSFNPDKLLWLNQHYIKTLPAARVAAELAWQMDRRQIDVREGPTLEAVVEAYRERAKTLAEMAEGSRFFYADPAEYDPKALRKHLVGAEAVLDALTEQLTAAQWTRPALHEAVEAVATALALKLGKVAQPLRVALTGTSVSPPIDVSLELVGREATLRRIARARELAAGLAA